jgi:hypothetical protein
MTAGGIHVYQLNEKYWRAWDHDRHVHSPHGYGSCAVDRTDKEAAIEALGDLLMESSPGLSCIEGVCPKYVLDLW